MVSLSNIFEVLTTGKTAVVITQGISSGTRFLYGMILLAVSDLNTYGNYILLWSAHWLLSAIQNALVLQPLQARNILYPRQTLIVINLLICIVSTGIFAYFNRLVIGFDNNVLGWLVVSSVFLIVWEYRKKELQMEFQDKKVLGAEIACALIFASILIVSYFSKATFDFGFVVSVYAVSLLIVVLFNVDTIKFFVFLESPSSLIKIKFYKELFPDSYLKLAKGYLKSNIFQFLSGHMHLYVSGLILSKDDVGFIGFVKNLLGPIALSAIAFDTVLARKFRELKTSASQIYSNLLRRMIYVTWLIGVLALISISLEKLFISFGVFSDGYFGVFTLSLLAVVASVMNRLPHAYYRALGVTNTISKASFYGLIMVMISVFPLVTFFGAIGAVTVILLQQFIIGIILFNRVGR